MIKSTTMGWPYTYLSIHKQGYFEARSLETAQINLTSFPGMIRQLYAGSIYSRPWLSSRASLFHTLTC